MSQLPLCSAISAADTNSTQLSITKECAPTNTSEWLVMQPNEISDFSAQIGKTARAPITADRGNRKGTVTSLTASPAFAMDTVMDGVRYFGDAFLYTQWKGAAPFGKKPTATTSTGYTVPTGTVAAAGTLVYAAGWVYAANNGLKVVTTGSTATEIKVAGLTPETANLASVLHIVGVRAAAGDLVIAADGSLTSTTLNFATLGLTVGQFIQIGGEATVNRFAQTADYGLARIETISANKLTFSATASPLVADTGTGKEVELYFGSFARDVAVTDADFVRTRFTMEASYNTSPVVYEYAREAYANTLELAMPNEDKSTSSFGFVARDITAPSATRMTTDLTKFKPMVQTTAFNTTSDFCRLRIDGLDTSGYTTYFKDTTISLDNGATPETVLGNLGAAFVNLGNFGVTLDTECVMTDALVLNAIRNNTTVSMTAGLRNADGAFVVDLPAMTLGDGSKSLTLNEKVKITASGEVFRSDRLGYSMGISLFGYLPSDAL